jgi:farnesyl-diphosphate farnesyltransferase
MTVESDIAFCEELLPQVSRTFALSIEALPEPTREYVRVAYLLCRILDTVEDATDVPLADRESLFDCFNGLLGSVDQDAREFEEAASVLGGEESFDVQLCRGASAVVRRYRSFPPEIRECLQGPILEMSDGMRSYVRRFATHGQHRISSTEDLEEYCYFVAGTVGKLLTGLFLARCPLPSEVAARLHEHKVSFGLGLQLVNILKDVADDLERGACFLPLDLLEERGVSPQDVLLPENRGAVMDIVEGLIERAQIHLDAAKRYVLCWPVEEGYPIRVFTLVPLALACASLSMVRRGGAQVLMPGENPKVSREFVMSVLSEVDGAARDDEKLVLLLERSGQYAA